MISLWRGNSYTEIHGASREALQKLALHLAVQISDPSTVKRDETRYHHIFQAADPITGESTLWATLLHGNVVPAGLTGHAQAILEHYGWKASIRDTREIPPEYLPLWSVRASWRPYQDGVHQAILNRGGGVIDAPPRSGKTLMLIRALDTLAQPALVVSPSLAIVKQTYDVFRGVFGDELVSRVDGNATPAERDLSKPFVIATIASAIRLPQEFFDSRKLLAIDEFHHGAAESYHKLNALAKNIYYRLCFTGTHFRTAEDRLAMEAICSDVIYQIPVQYLVDEKWLAPPRYVVTMTKDSPRLSVREWAEVYERGIVKDAHRNKLVTKIAAYLGIECNIPTIVLVRRREHARILHKMIPDSKVVMGGDNALTGKVIDDFRAGMVPVLIGTTVIGEGVDLPNAGALVYASGGGATVQQIQSYFRPLTANPGKEVGLIYDFKDIHHPTLSRHSDERMALAESCLATQAVRLW